MAPMGNLTAGLSDYLAANSALAYPIVFLGGILASFTPCVYPVIPITVSYVGARSRGSRGRGFLLSLVYVLGMAVTYAFLGAFAALTGKLFGRIQTSPWTYLAVANVCILMGLSLLDVFALPVPAFFHRIPKTAGGEGWFGSFTLGLVSGLVIGPCAAPILIVLLTYVAARQNLFFGVSLLFTFALGMGVLLVVLGTFVSLLAGLPRAGAWMTGVKKSFGFLLIATGEYFLVKAGTMLW